MAYKLGKAAAPPFAIMSAACFGYLAYVARRSPPAPESWVPRWVLYAVAAVAVPSIVPYTLAVMEPVANLRLLALAEQSAKREVLSAGEGEVQRLLGIWKGMNYVRAILVGAGAMLGAVATIGV